jgi:hypothetical protein
MPIFSAPSLGAPLSPQFSYVKRKSAEHQADMWNEFLLGYPEMGPDSGFKVGVGGRDADGRWMLVWVSAR